MSDFTHEEAVEAIRQAGDKVELLVQNPQVTHTCTQTCNNRFQVYDMNISVSQPHSLLI